MTIDTLSSPLTATQEDLIAWEVLQEAKPMFAAAQKMDPEWVAKYCAHVPDFWISWYNGKTSNFAEAERTWKDLTHGAASSHCTIRAERCKILDAENAITFWEGSLEWLQKDGHRFLLDPFTETEVLRKIGHAWRIVSKTQSGLPAHLQP